MINFAPLYSDSIVPQRSTLGSAGYDLYSHQDVTIPPNKTVLIKTGVSVKMTEKDVMFVCSRSGLALKNNVFVLNAPGVVDSDYYPNEVGVILHNNGDERFQINKGDRIAQAVFTEFKTSIVDNVKSEERTGGFGSTGINNV